MKSKVPRIAGFEVHYKLKGQPERISAVDYYRVVQPLKYLKKIYGWDTQVFKDPFKDSGYKNWIELAKYFDVAYSSYNSYDIGYVSMAIHGLNNNMKVAMDLDDNIWEIDETNPVYKAMNPKTKDYFFATQIIKDVKSLTATNHFLKDKIFQFTKNFNTTVLPNYIDLELYKYPKTLKRDDKINIIYWGSSTHLKDLIQPHFEKAILRICEEFPQVNIKMAGMYNPMIEDKLGKRFKYLGGYPNFLTYIKKIWQTDVCSADIGLAPLEITDFTKAKSNLKYLEGAAAKLPMVLTNITQYRKSVTHGVDGFLAETEEDWYKYLKMLVESKELRDKIGGNAYKNIVDNHTIQGNIWRYKNYFQKLLDIDNTV